MFPDFEPFRDKLTARGIHNGAELCDRLLQDTGVAILPGDCFGRPEEELTARMAFVDFDGAKVLAAAEQIAADLPLDDDFLSQYCEKVLTAIQLICDWLGTDTVRP